MRLSGARYSPCASMTRSRCWIRSNTMPQTRRSTRTTSGGELRRVRSALHRHYRMIHNGHSRSRNSIWPGRRAMHGLPMRSRTWPASATGKRAISRPFTPSPGFQTQSRKINAACSPRSIGFACSAMWKCSNCAFRSRAPLQRSDGTSARHHSGPHSIAAALCAPMIAQLRYEQGRLDEAEALLVELMPVIELAVFLDSVLISYRILIRIAVARSNFAHAYALLDGNTGQALGQARRWNRPDCRRRSPGKNPAESCRGPACSRLSSVRGTCVRPVGHLRRRVGHCRVAGDRELPGHEGCIASPYDGSRPRRRSRY